MDNIDEGTGVARKGSVKKESAKNDDRWTDEERCVSLVLTSHMQEGNEAERREQSNHAYSF